MEITMSGPMTLTDWTFTFVVAFLALAEPAAMCQFPYVSALNNTDCLNTTCVQVYFFLLAYKVSRPSQKKFIR